MFAANQEANTAVGVRRRFLEMVILRSSRGKHTTQALPIVSESIDAGMTLSFVWSTISGTTVDHERLWLEIETDGTDFCRDFSGNYSFEFKNHDRSILS